MSQLLRLVRPFPNKFVKPPAQGKHGDYVAHDVVNQRLLMDVGPFDYQIVEVIRDTDGLVDGCIAEMVVQVDGRTVTVREAGECDLPAQKKTNGERLKHASSDAFKRCAMRLGVGLHLWSGADYFLHVELTKREAPQQTDTKRPPPAPLAATVPKDGGVAAFSSEPF